MTRQERLLSLQAAGIYHGPGRYNHPLWIEAMQEYIKDTGDKEVNLNCGGCVKKIKNWLER